MSESQIENAKQKIASLTQRIATREKKKGKTAKVLRANRDEWIRELAIFEADTAAKQKALKGLEGVAYTEVGGRGEVIATTDKPKTETKKTETKAKVKKTETAEEGRERQEERRFDPKKEPEEPPKKTETESVDVKAVELPELKPLSRVSTVSSVSTTGYDQAEQEKRRATGSQTDQEKVQIQIQEAKDSLKKAESYTEAYGKKVTFGGKTYDLGTSQGVKDYQAAVREYKSQIHRAETNIKLASPTTWTVGDKTFDTSYKAAQYAKNHPVYVIEGVNKTFDSEAEAQKYVRGLEAAATGPPAPDKNKIIKSSTVTPPGMVYHLGALMTQKQFEQDFPKGTKPSGPIITSTSITAASLWNAWEDVFTPKSKRLDKMSDALTNEAAEAMYDGKPWTGFVKYLQAKGVDASKTVYETTTGLVRPQSWVDLAQGVGLILTPTEQLSRKEYMARIDAQIESDINDPALRAEIKDALMAVAPYQTVSDEAIKKGKEYRSQLGSAIAKDPFGAAVNIGTAIVGGYALGKLVNGARSALEREAIKRTRGSFSIEDYYIPDELMEMERIRYPAEVSGYETFYDQVLVKQNMRMISELDGSGAIAWSPELLSKRIPEGMLYKLGTEAHGYEYGLLRTGGDLIPVAIPKGKGELIPVYKPEMVNWVQNWVQHTPGALLDLETAALQGYRLPAWLGVLGPGAKITSKEISAELTKIGLNQRKINAILPTIRTIPEFSQRDINKLKDILKKKSVEDIKLTLFDLADKRSKSIQDQRERQDLLKELDPKRIPDLLEKLEELEELEDIPGTISDLEEEQEEKLKEKEEKLKDIPDTIPDLEEEQEEKLKDIPDTIPDLEEEQEEKLKEKEEEDSITITDLEEEIQEEDYEGVPDLPPTSDEDEPPPEEPPPTPFLPKSKPEERRDIRLRLFNGPKEKYKVKWTFPGGTAQTLTVEARSFPEAVNKAQRGRRSNKYHPNLVDITRNKG